MSLAVGILLSPARIVEEPRMRIELWDDGLPDDAVAILRAEIGVRDEPEEELGMTLELAESTSGLAFVARAAIGPVGVLVAEAEPSTRSAFVRWLVVDPAARRSGVGTALVAALAATPGIEWLRGMVDQEDLVASRFWRDVGWTVPRPRPGRRRQMMSSDLPDAPQAAA
jgi:GNAT superfamily N-acetyltransferase